MAIGGPFTSYERPDVYTQTRNDAPVATIAGAIKFPVLIGVGDEFVQVNNEEVIRGSSAIADNPVTKEDVSSQLDGVVNYFYVENFPIVSGDGSGTTTTRTTDVQVFVNKNPAAVAIVEGSTGKITLQNIPRADDVVQVSYFYKNTDTLITDEDLSDQADGTNKAFKVLYDPIVDGTNGGITTTDPNKVTVKVNDVAVTVSEVDGADGVVTLALAPAATDEVLVTYYYNRYRNTSDPLQYPNVLEVDLVGLVPDKADFTETVDFVLKNDEIHWGTTYIIEAGTTTPNSEPFDDTQLTASLVDNRFYLREVVGTVDGINAVFTLEDTPVDGTGTDVDTEDTSKIQVYVGTDIQTALGAGQVVVLKIDSSTNEITLKNAPAIGETVYVTQYRNFIIDDQYTFECTTTGVGGVGEYTITSLKNGEIATIAEGTHNVADAADFATEGITWPNGVSDLATTPGTSISETVTVTFTSAYDYTVSSNQALGSSGFGHLDQTYYDSRTGVRFTVLKGTTVTYAPGDTLEFISDKGGDFLSGPLFYNAIPGLRTRVVNLLDVTPGDTAIISTYNKAGNEPNVGDFYYVTYKYEKTDYDTVVVTKWRDVEAYSGTLSLSNKLTLAAWLAFQNGAIKLGLKQIQKAPGQQDATVTSYKSAIDEMKKELRGHGYPYLVQPITTNAEVLDYLKFHNELMSSIRYKGERVSVFGYAAGTDFEDAISFAQGIKSDRMIGVYPDTAIISLNDEYGNEFESSVDGSFLAAAMAGLIVNPIYDEATPLTTKSLIGFKRLGSILDTVEMNTVASAGITVLEEKLPSIEIRHFLTTNPDNILTQEPNVIFIKDKVQKTTRDTLKEFIGQKFLDKIIQDVEEKLASMFNSFIGAEIVAEYTGIEATRDENDPRILNVVGYYRPVFGLLWIKVSYNLRTTL